MKTVALIILAVIVYNFNRTSSQNEIKFNANHTEFKNMQNSEIELANKDEIKWDKNVNYQSPIEKKETIDLDWNRELSIRKHVKIIGLGNIERNKLENAAEIVNEFYGYETTIMDNISINPEICFDDGETLNAEKALEQLNKLANNTSLLTIYITNNNLYTSSNVRLRGYTYINGKTIVLRSNPEFIKETLIHEIGHTKGLNHCNDLTCIMAINNDEADSGDFCPRCKNEIALNN
jgi:predicted Zn-dependent protease